jgi:hypothetical protein
MGVFISLWLTLTHLQMNHHQPPPHFNNNSNSSIALLNRLAINLTAVQQMTQCVNRIKVHCLTRFIALLIASWHHLFAYRVQGTIMLCRVAFCHSSLPAIRQQVRSPIWAVMGNTRTLHGKDYFLKMCSLSRTRSICSVVFLPAARFARVWGKTSPCTLRPRLRS